jgi:hypothetical protein
VPYGVSSAFIGIFQRIMESLLNALCNLLWSVCVIVSMKLILIQSKAKVKPVQEAPATTNVTELKAYLGLLNFYGKFIPNLSTELEPLYQLL